MVKNINDIKEYAVVMKNITKVYPGGIIANYKIDFNLRYGEIHSLLGENGAGKTTLMKVLAGCLIPDEGEIYVKGEKTKFKSPSDAMKKGIGIVHQHFTLIPSFTVAENVVLGSMGKIKEKMFLDYRTIAKKVEEFAKKHGLSINPYVKVKELPVGLRQRVEILRLLYRKADILILDEPTSVLTPLEVKELFDALKNLKKEGKSVIFVTHKVKEALAISDRITVLRKGRKVATVSAKKVDETKLAELIVGERLVSPMLKRLPKVSNKEPILKIKNVKVLDDRGVLAVKGVSLEVYPGEILGIAGVEGNGQKELVEAIVGLRRTIEGRIYILGKDVTNKNPKDIILLGTSYIPEDRIGRGVALTLTLAENAVIKVFDRAPFSKKGILNLKYIHEFASNLIKKYNIVAPNTKVPVMFLSGGNIQRLILARELSLNPKFIIAEHPTAGLDIAATNFIHNMLIEFRNRGCGILLISANLDEILKLSDRVAVMYNGEILKIYRSAAEINLTELGKLMLGICK